MKSVECEYLYLKETEQCFLVVLFIMLHVYKGGSKFEPLVNAVEKIIEQHCFLLYC